VVGIAQEMRTQGVQSITGPPIMQRFTPIVR
jgi:hypothetical protein